ncbi:MAG: DUF4301 family protein, partial [Calditrichota bacterium]
MTPDSSQAVNTAASPQNNDSTEPGKPDYKRSIRAATIGDGILEISKNSEERLIRSYNMASAEGRSSHLVLIEENDSFFGALQDLYDEGRRFDLEILEHSAETADDYAAVRFFKRLSVFPFFADLQTAFLQNGECLETLLEQKQHDKVLHMLFDSSGLGYRHKPLALIKCHQYLFDSRTFLEEHLVSCTTCVQDHNMMSRVYVAAPEYQANALQKGLQRSIDYYQNYGVTFKTELLKLENGYSSPDGFIRALGKTSGDIVFVRSLTNTLHDRLKAGSMYQRKIIGGVLVEMQELIYYYCDRIRHGVIDDEFLNHVVGFIQNDLNFEIPETVFDYSMEEISRQLLLVLNRPIRVCSVIPTSLESQSGPFWVSENDRISLQLLHRDEVDATDTAAKTEWDNALFLNPVDMVCGIRDSEGNLFDLSAFGDALETEKTASVN